MEVEVIDSSLCRTCLSKENTRTVNLDLKWATKIEYCLGFEVTTCSSKKLCEKCVKIIEDFYEFKENVYKVNRYWQNYGAHNEITETNLKIENLDEDKTNDDKIGNFSIFSKKIQYEYNQDSLISMKYESASDSNIQLDEDYRHILVSNVETKEIKRPRKTKRRLIKSAKNKYVCGGGKKNKNVDTDKNKIANCETCNLCFKNTKTYINHCKRKHGIDSVPTEYHCGLCNFVTGDKYSRKTHLTEHFNNKELDCKLCDFTGSDLAEMEGHRFSHYPEKGINLNCHACDSSHKNSLTLEYHYRSVHLKKKGGYCKHCDKEFGAYRTWRNHDRKHKGNNFICDICGFKFLFRNQIISHIMCHNKVKSKICDYCGLGFTSTYCLKVHIRGIHTKHSPVVCAHCNKTFKSQYTLDHHMKIVNADKPFECSVCFKKYESQNSLASHMIWHSDARPFTCDICNSKFKCKSYLTVHKMRHAGHVKIKCSYCDKGFTAKRNLLIHESIHTGVRLYKCTQCGKSYNHKKIYLKHLSTHGSS